MITPNSDMQHGARATHMKVEESISGPFDDAQSAAWCSGASRGKFMSLCGQEFEKHLNRYGQFDYSR